jgi:hypothetical protein
MVEATGTTAGAGFVRLEASGGFDGTIGSTAQIGHGGYLAGGSAEGGIDVTANGPDDTFFAIDLAAPGDENFARIGHGGTFFNDADSGALSGAIEINAPAGGIRAAAGSQFGSVQIGHGGDGAFADSIMGTIQVTVLGDIRFTAGDDEEAYAQLGHGGVFSEVDSLSGGDIEIVATGDLHFTGGTGDTAYAQLGHGGAHSEGVWDGAISINANDLFFTGGSVVENSYAQLGHGGNEASGDFTGDFMITANGISFLGGSVNDAYAQLGHGGDNADGNHGGDIEIDATGDLNFMGGSGEDAYAQLGHGGVEFDGDLFGDIVVQNAASLSLIAGPDSAYARVGHGGDGFTFGAVTDADIGLLVDGPITLTAAESSSTAQIGHGGTFTFFDVDDGDIFFASRGLALSSTGDGATAQVGHGGLFSGFAEFQGDILGFVLGDVTLHAGGEDSTAQIGHGGSFAFGLADGNILLAALGLSMTADGVSSTAQIGHGGFFTGVDIDLTGESNIGVLTLDDVTLSANAEESTAQIGHGGRFGGGEVAVSVLGDIGVLSVDGSISLTADQSAAMAQIGHGGQEFVGTAEGAIYAIARNDVTLTATGNPSEARIGHLATPGFFERLASPALPMVGDIVVFAGKNIALNADSANRAQIGHGEVGSVNPGVPLFATQGHIVAAWDIESQFLGADQGNRLLLGEGAVIGVGGDPANEVRLFGFRRGPDPNVGGPGNNFYADGAIIGGYTYDSSLPRPTPATPGSSWRENTEFVSWEHEQWGFPLPLDVSMPLLVDLTGLPYTAPFTFYYPDQTPPPPTIDIPPTVPVLDIYWQFTAHGFFSETVMYMFPNNPYFSNFGPPAERPLGELAGGSSP